MSMLPLLLAWQALLSRNLYVYDQQEHCYTSFACI